MKKIIEAATFIRSKIDKTPSVCVILGSGLHAFGEEVTQEISIPYADIPHFPIATVEGHAGNLLFTVIHNVPTVIMQGRLHYYEGYSMSEITFPIRVLKQLGIQYLFVSNASGGLNPDYKTGDIMIINDHINFFPEHPLRGKNYDTFGVRFPDMSETYNKMLIQKALSIAKTHKIPVHQGVYIGSSGPSLETAAEYRMFRLWGADATGMSTVPEIIVAHHANIQCFGISIITNESKDCADGKITTYTDVQKNAKSSEPLCVLFCSNLLKHYTNDLYK
ncbi:MAG TPA: purine-nucleoside phosphorylase [Bacteroidales bacterium]|nr:purine-nucleoside phosphorylase [Bacteroidales bacterium]